MEQGLLGFFWTVQRVVEDDLPLESRFCQIATAIVQPLKLESHVEVVQHHLGARRNGDLEIADAGPDHEFCQLRGDQRCPNIAGPLDLQLLGENPLKNLGALGIGFFPGNELGIREPETPGAPLMVVLRDILDDHGGWPIADPLPFNVRVEAESAVVGAASLRLDPDGFTQIFLILREDRGQVGQVDGERIEQGRRALLALSNGLSLPEDVALVLQRLAFNDLEDGVFTFPKNPDGAFREFLDELIGKGGKGSPADHDLRLRELLRDQPGVGECRPDMTVVAVELLQPRKRGDDPLEWIARKVEIKRMFQRGVSLMR